MLLRPRSSPRTAGPLRTALVAALLASGLSACGLLGSEAASTTTEPTTTTSTTAPPVAVSEPPQVLDPGAEPRTSLRMAYTEGQTATISFTSDLAVDQGTEADAPTQGIDSPPINQTLTYTVGAVTAEGAQLTMEITDVEVRAEDTGLSDAEVQALQTELDPLVGITGTGTITPLGELQDLSFALPGDLDEPLQAQLATLDQQITGLGPALPSEPVGIGARWSVSSTSDAGGPEVRTETTYELTELADGQLAYTATIASSAEPQDLEIAGLPKGSTAALQSSDLEGTTTGTLLLDRPGFTLDTRLSGPQVLVLTAADGTASTVHQQIRLAYRAATTAS